MGNESSAIANSSFVKARSIAIPPEQLSSSCERKIKVLITVPPKEDEEKTRYVYLETTGDDISRVKVRAISLEETHEIVNSACEREPVQLVAGPEDNNELGTGIPNLVPSVVMYKPRTTLSKTKIDTLHPGSSLVKIGAGLGIAVVVIECIRKYIKISWTDNSKTNVMAYPLPLTFNGLDVDYAEHDLATGYDILYLTGSIANLRAYSLYNPKSVAVSSSSSDGDDDEEEKALNRLKKTSSPAMASIIGALMESGGSITVGGGGSNSSGLADGNDEDDFTSDERPHLRSKRTNCRYQDIGRLVKTSLTTIGSRHKVWFECHIYSNYGLTGTTKPAYFIQLDCKTPEDLHKLMNEMKIDPTIVATRNHLFPISVSLKIWEHLKTNYHIMQKSMKFLEEAVAHVPLE